MYSLFTSPVEKDYNNNMGAIDKNDQLKKTYSIHHKSKRWWMRIFFHLLDICHLNTFIMYQQCYVQWNSGPVEEDVTPMMDQKAFTSSLVKSLCGNHTSRKQSGRPSLSPPSLLLRTSGYESVNIVKLEFWREEDVLSAALVKTEKERGWRQSMAAYNAVCDCAVINALTFSTVG